jgi:tocopherol O-methyltransferase
MLALSVSVFALRAPVFRTKVSLTRGIAQFYDESSGAWERSWGEHMHHGYYGVDGDERKDHRQAQVDMIDAALNWSGVENRSQMHILDVGCGIGGSLRHMMREYDGSTGVGITLSRVQSQRANALSRVQGLDNCTDFCVADAQSMPFPDNSFDIVWSMESGEHMPDKARFVSEMARVCKPGGHIILVAWCHRSVSLSPLTAKEDRMLAQISDAFFLPQWCSVDDYKCWAKEYGLSVVRCEDWTKRVKRFWPAVILSALRPRALLDVIRSGPKTMRGATVMPLMIRGQHKGLIQLGALSMRKPDDQARFVRSVPSSSVPSPSVPSCLLLV